MRIGIPAVVVSLSLGLSACGGSGADSPHIATVTDELRQGLQFLREEEKLARDVYLTLYDTWALMPHTNIAAQYIGLAELQAIIDGENEGCGQ